MLHERGAPPVLRDSQDLARPGVGKRVHEKLRFLRNHIGQDDTAYSTDFGVCSVDDRICCRVHARYVHRGIVPRSCTVAQS